MDAGASTGEGARRGRIRRTRPAAQPALAYLVAATALLVDVGASGWAATALRGRGRVWVWRPWLALHLITNSGATLGMFAGHPGIFTAVAAAAVIVLAILVPRWPRGCWGLALMLGGAAGNLASRLMHGGAVLDFLEFRLWPGIFNPADLFLRGGALWAFLAFATGATTRGGPRG